jgi:HEPN domain-containing protein
MAKSREDLVKWSLRKAEEYLESARQNLDENRLFPAAEEIFRSVETTL